MARVTTYLNFSRNTEEAFNYYKSVFGGEFGGQGIVRFNDIPPAEGVPSIDKNDKHLIMHIELAIIEGTYPDGNRCSGINGV
jgi:PhnB protein